nr:hypothetical protein [Rhizobium phaseoli]
MVRVSLQELAAGVHHGNDRTGKILAEPQRRSHRNGGEKVQPELSGTKSCNDVHGKRQQCDDDTSGKHIGGCRRQAGKTERDRGDDAKRRQQNENNRTKLAQWV